MTKDWKCARELGTRSCSVWVLPSSHLPSPFIEDSLVVPLANLLTGFLTEGFPIAPARPISVAGEIVFDDNYCNLPSNAKEKPPVWSGCDGRNLDHLDHPPQWVCHYTFDPTGRVPWGCSSCCRESRAGTEVESPVTIGEAVKSPSSQTSTAFLDSSATK